MAQQQQSNPIRPQTIGGKKMPLNNVSMDAPAKGQKKNTTSGASLVIKTKMATNKAVAKGMKDKTPSFSKVEKSVKKSMGYK